MQSKSQTVFKPTLKLESNPQHSNFGVQFWNEGKLIRHIERQEKKQDRTVGTQGQEEVPGPEGADQGK